MRRDKDSAFWRFCNPGLYTICTHGDGDAISVTTANKTGLKWMRRRDTDSINPKVVNTAEEAVCVEKPLAIEDAAGRASSRPPRAPSRSQQRRLVTPTPARPLQGQILLTHGGLVQDRLGWPLRQAAVPVSVHCRHDCRHGHHSRHGYGRHCRHSHSRHPQCGLVLGSCAVRNGERVLILRPFSQGPPNGLFCSGASARLTPLNTPMYRLPLRPPLPSPPPWPPPP